MAHSDQLTLPEVLSQLDALRDHCRSMADEADPEDIWSCDMEALDAAIAALRPITREQIDRAEWRTTVDNGAPMYVCSACGARAVKGLYEYDNPRLFCYHCGRPMTDEAVEILMERLEAQHEKAN